MGRASSVKAENMLFPKVLNPLVCMHPHLASSLIKNKSVSLIHADMKQFSDPIGNDSSKSLHVRALERKTVSRMKH